MRWLLLALLLIPAIEISVFIWIGRITGPLWIVFLIVLTGFLGILIARRQGIDTWRRAQLQINKGLSPTEELLDGICIIIGAVLLFAPGFVTDTLGFLLVLPITRKPLKQMIRKILNKIGANRTIIYKKW